MSYLNWPHPPYAEDQPYAKTILYTHVIYRGVEVGALFGSLYALVRVFRPFPKNNAAAATSASSASASASISKTTQFFRHAGKAPLLGAALMTLALTGHMRGREDVEWQDRSWRLLENRGMRMQDRFSDLGFVLGGLSVITKNRENGAAAAGGGGFVRNIRPSWEMLGRAGVGCLAGCAVYQVYRGFRKEKEERRD